MDENKKETALDAVEDTIGAVEDKAEEIVEAVEEAEDSVEEAVEEMAEELEEAIEDSILEEDSSEAEKYVSVTELINQVSSLKKKKLVWKIIAIVLAVVVLAGGVCSLVGAVKAYNPYNNMGYPNLSGLTVGNMTKFYGITMEDIIEEYSLPDDVKEDTYYDVIQYLAPTSMVIEMYGMDFETAKETLKFADSITPETPWGVAEDSMPLSVIIGDDEAALNEFIEHYSLKGDITGDTLWGKVRKQVLKKDYEDSLAPAEEADEEILSEDNVVQSELTEEELAEIMAYLESATDIVE